MINHKLQENDLIVEIIEEIVIELIVEISIQEEMKGIVTDIEDIAVMREEVVGIIIDHIKAVIEVESITREIDLVVMIDHLKVRVVMIVGINTIAAGIMIEKEERIQESIEEEMIVEEGVVETIISMIKREGAEVMKGLAEAVALIVDDQSHLEKLINLKTTNLILIS